MQFNLGVDTKPFIYVVNPDSPGVPANAGINDVYFQGSLEFTGNQYITGGTLNIAAGTTTRCPIKLSSGTNLTTPEVGAIEFDGTDLYITTSGLSRKTLATTESVITSSRTISTTAPLSGGGDLSANRTLSIAAASTSVDGYLTSTDWNTFNNKVGTSRTISTTAPLSGGGDLSSNRTLSMTAASTSVDGYLTSTDWNTFNNKLSSTAVGSTGQFIYNNAGSYASAPGLTYSSGKVGIGAGTVVTQAHIFTSTATDGLTIENTNAGASGSLLDLYHNSASSAADDVIGIINFSGKDSGSTKTIYAKIESLIEDTTNTSEDGKLVLSTMVGGSLVDAIKIESGNRYLYDSSSAISIEWNLRYLIDGGGSAFSVGWDERVLYDTVSSASLNWTDRNLLNSIGSVVLNWSDKLTIGVGTAVTQAHIFTSTATDGLTIENTNAGAGGTLLNLYHNSASPAANDVNALINFSGESSTGAERVYAQVKSIINTTTNTSEVGELVFSSMRSGTLTESFRINSSGSLLLAAGTTTKAPLTLTSGTNLTSPVSGAIEFDGTNLYVTQTSGPTRQTLAFTSSLSSYVPTSRTISTTAPLSGGGDLSANRTLSMAAASTSVDGYLTSTDWNTFNNKLSSTSVGTSGQFIYNNAGSYASAPGLTYSSGKVGIGVGTAVTQAHIFTSTATDGLTIENSNAGTSGSLLDLYHNSASPVANDVIANIDFSGENASSAKTTYARIQALISDTTNTSEDGQLIFSTVVGGSLVDAIKIETNGGGRYLYDSSGNISVNWESRVTKDVFSVDSLSFALRSLYDSSGNSSISWEDHLIYDYAGELSIDWENRNLLNSSGSVILNWSDKLTIGVGTAVTQAHIFTSTATDGLTIENSNAGTSGSLLDLYHNSASPVANDVTATINFTGKSSTGITRTYSAIKQVIGATTNAAENGKLVLSTMNAGTLTDVLTINPTSTVYSTTTTAGGEAAHWVINANGNGYSAVYIYCGNQYYRNVQVGQSITPSGRFLAGSAHFETGGTGGFTYTIGTSAALNNCFRWYISNQSNPVMVIDSLGGGNIQLGKSNISSTANGKSNAMLARVNCIQNTTDTKVVRTETEQSAGDSVIEDVIQQKITTTDATVTYSSTTQATATGYTYMIETIVVAVRTGGSSGSAGDGASYKLQGHFRNISGTVTQPTATSKTVIHETTDGMDCDFNINSTNIRVSVTGVASTNFTWHVTSKIYFLNS